MRSVTRLIIALVIFLLPASIACRKAPTTSNEVVAIPASTAPLDPQDRLWEGAPEFLTPLILQDLVDPRLMKVSTPEIRVRAIADGSLISFRIEWADKRMDNLPAPGQSLDGCAVQLPTRIEADAPAPQMGEAGRPVEVTFWRADWQSWGGGKGDSIRDLYPNASVDHYPFQARPLEPGSGAQKDMELRYSPARVLGNQRSGPREIPIENLISEGPGTLKPDKEAGANGKGIRTEKGWQVVLRRSLPRGLESGARTRVAFAVWEGSQGESGSRKMRTGWIPLLRK